MRDIGAAVGVRISNPKNHISILYFLSTLMNLKFA